MLQMKGIFLLICFLKPKIAWLDNNEDKYTTKAKVIYKSRNIAVNMDDVCGKYPTHLFYPITTDLNQIYNWLCYPTPQNLQQGLVQVLHKYLHDKISLNS